MYVQNLPVAHVFAVIGLYSLLFVFDSFLLWLALLRDWTLLDGGFTFLQSTLRSEERRVGKECA